MPLDAGSVRLHRTGRGPTLVMLHRIGHRPRSQGGQRVLANQSELVSYELLGHDETPVRRAIRDRIVAGTALTAAYPADAGHLHALPRDSYVTHWLAL